MPLLDRHGLKSDVFARAGDAAITKPLKLLVTMESLPAALSEHAGESIGVEIANTVDAASLLPYFNHLALIAIAFPAYSDGRGFSIARRLRDLGFRGTIRAVGPLIADQFVQAIACGIDEIEVSEAHLAHQPVEDWQAALKAISSGYQSTYRWSGTILDQRRAARQKSGQL